MRNRKQLLSLLILLVMVVGGSLFLLDSGFFAAAASPEALRTYIDRFAPYSHLCFFLVQLLSVVLAPIPSNITAAAGGMLSVLGLPFSSPLRPWQPAPYWYSGWPGCLGGLS